MDDILLGHDEAKDIEQAAMAAVWQRGGDITEQLLAGEKAVLRAQVRKVVDLYHDAPDGPCPATPCPWGLIHVGGVSGTQCAACKQSFFMARVQAALRAAAEEVKG